MEKAEFGIHQAALGLASTTDSQSLVRLERCVHVCSEPISYNGVTQHSEAQRLTLELVQLCRGAVDRRGVCPLPLRVRDCCLSHQSRLISFSFGLREAGMGFSFP